MTPTEPELPDSGAGDPPPDEPDLGDGSDDAARMAQELVASRRQLDSARRAPQQFRAGFLLQCLDRLRHCRLRYPELRRRQGQLAGFARGDEILDLPQGKRHRFFRYREVMISEFTMRQPWAKVPGVVPAPGSGRAVA